MRDKGGLVVWTVEPSETWNENYAEAWNRVGDVWLAERAPGDGETRPIMDVPTEGLVRYRPYDSHTGTAGANVEPVELPAAEAFLDVTIREYDEAGGWPKVWRADAGGFHAVIYQDEGGSGIGDPRDATNVSRIVHWHRNYTIASDAEQVDTDRFRSARAIRRYLGIMEDAVCILPLGMIDHSGISFYVGDSEHWCDPGGWDSGQVGFVYATRESCAEVGIDPADTAAVELALRQDVAALDAYARGEVYGYYVDDADGQTYDACGGYLAVDDVERTPLRGNRNDPLAYIKQEAMDSLIMYATDEARERERAEAIGIPTVSA